jgi:hypothetical protein
MNLVYKPDWIKDIPEESKVYVKFSNNIYFDESFLKKHNIEYKPEDLEDTPLGKRFVVRRDSKGQNLGNLNDN